MIRFGVYRRRKARQKRYFTPTAITRAMLLLGANPRPVYVSPVTSGWSIRFSGKPSRVDGLHYVVAGWFTRDCPREVFVEAVSAAAAELDHAATVAA